MGGAGRKESLMGEVGLVRIHRIRCVNDTYRDLLPNLSFVSGDVRFKLQ